MDDSDNKNDDNSRIWTNKHEKIWNRSRTFWSIHYGYVTEER
jgi:hypothetical protein